MSYQTLQEKVIGTARIFSGVIGGTCLLTENTIRWSAGDNSDYQNIRRKGTRMQLLQYQKCSTCKKAVDWLKEHHISFEDRPIKEQNPTEKELKEWYQKSGLPLKRFFNTSGNLYKELQLKDKLPGMSEEEQLKLLATDGMLVKRPLMIGEDFVLAGFKESEWAEKLLH